MKKRRSSEEMGVRLWVLPKCQTYDILTFLSERDEGATIEEIAEIFEGTKEFLKPPGHSSEIEVDLDDSIAVRKCRIENLAEHIERLDDSYEYVTGSTPKYIMREGETYKVTGRARRALEREKEIVKWEDKWRGILEERIVPYVLGEVMRRKLEIDPFIYGVRFEVARELIKRDGEIPNEIAELDDRDFKRLFDGIEGVVAEMMGRGSFITFDGDKPWNIKY